MNTSRREPDAHRSESRAANVLSTVNRSLAKGLMFLSSLIMVAMVLHIVVDITLRFLFNVSISGTIEIVSNWYMVAVAFLPLAYVQLRREHLIVEVFTQSASRRTLLWIDSIVYAICIGVLILYIVQVTDTAIAKTEIAETVETPWFQVPVWPTRWFLPIGLGAMALCMLAQVLTGMRSEPDAAAQHSDE